MKKLGLLMILTGLIWVVFSSTNIFTFSTAQLGNGLGMVIPLYIYPTIGTSWNQVIQAKLLHPTVPFLVIVNPNSGVGTFQDANYVTGIQNLQNAGIQAIGYVYTNYCLISIPVAENQILLYKQWYHVNGIFFDSMSSQPGCESYYQTLNIYAKSLGMTITAGNAGTTFVSLTYIGTTDIINIYEGAGVPTIYSISNGFSNYPKTGFAIICYSTPLNTAFISQATPYIGYIYMTDVNPPSQYNQLPSYFNSLVATLDTSSTSTTTTTATSTTTTTTTSTITSVSTTTSTYTTTTVSSGTTSTITSTTVFTTTITTTTSSSSSSSGPSVKNPVFGLLLAGFGVVLFVRKK